MEILLIVLAVILVFLGMLGSILPALPGPPLSYAGLLLLFWVEGTQITLVSLCGFGVLMLLLTLFDYVAPIWLTRMGGGSKKATWGTTIGMLVGLFFLPWGIILGPFLGALVGEMMESGVSSQAVKVAFLSFVGFLLTTGLKLIYCLILLLYVGYLVVAMLWH